MKLIVIYIIVTLEGDNIMSNLKYQYSVIIY